MKTIKTTLAAAFVLTSAAAALAQSGEEMQNSRYLYDPNAPVPIYQNQQAAPLAQAPLIEGRNVDTGAQAHSYQPRGYSAPSQIVPSYHLNFEDGASRESFGG